MLGSKEVIKIGYRHQRFAVDVWGRRFPRKDTLGIRISGSGTVGKD